MRKRYEKNNGLDERGREGFIGRKTISLDWVRKDVTIRLFSLSYFQQRFQRSPIKYKHEKIDFMRLAIFI